MHGQEFGRVGNMDNGWTIRTHQASLDILAVCDRLNIQPPSNGNRFSERTQSPNMKQITCRRSPKLPTLAAVP